MIKNIAIGVLVLLLIGAFAWGASEMKTRELREKKLKELTGTVDGTPKTEETKK